MIDILKKGAMKVGKYMINHGPEMALASGIATTTLCVALGVKATVKATNTVNELNRRRIEYNEQPLTKKEVVKAVAKDYIPTLITYILAIVSQAAGYKASAKRLAVISAAMDISTKAFDELQKKVSEKIGQEEAKIMASEAKESALISSSENNSLKTDLDNNLVIASDCEYLLRDHDIAFKMSLVELRDRFTTLRNKLMTEMFVSIDEWHDILGIKHSANGSNVGFDIQKVGPNARIYYDINPVIEGNTLFMDICYDTSEYKPLWG